VAESDPLRRGVQRTRVWGLSIGSDGWSRCTGRFAGMEVVFLGSPICCARDPSLRLKGACAQDDSVAVTPNVPRLRIGSARDPSLRLRNAYAQDDALQERRCVNDRTTANAALQSCDVHPSQTCTGHICYKRCHAQATALLRLHHDESPPIACFVHRDNW
jgi:hypothetical protein